VFALGGFCTHLVLFPVFQFVSMDFHSLSFLINVGPFSFDCVGCFVRVFRDSLFSYILSLLINRIPAATKSSLLFYLAASTC